MLADPRRSLGVAALLAAAAVIVCIVVWSTDTRSAVQWVDDSFLRLVERLRLEPLIDTAKALAFIGGAVCTWVIRAAVLALLAWRRKWLHLSAFVLAVVTSEALIGPLKALYDRPRPIGSLVETSSPSFPSGHAIAGAVTAVGIVIVMLPPGHSRWVWERRAALYASLMALSRTYLGAHWLSDVVAGSLIGSSLAIGCPAILVLWRARSSKHPDLADP
ncbi:MAG TPA: phosphatase PAP2 family protein [Acidimicrobiales bacterium]|nr:phosphatase PAP2 family protein [Acidimicrobiales bacterium]